VFVWINGLLMVWISFVLCTFFIRNNENQFCVLVLFLHEINYLRCFFFLSGKWHSRITPKLETHNGILILENTVSFINFQIMYFWTIVMKRRWNASKCDDSFMEIMKSTFWPFHYFQKMSTIVHFKRSSIVYVWLNQELCSFFFQCFSLWVYGFCEFEHSNSHSFVLNLNTLLCYRSAGKELLSLIALSLNLDENYFEKISALNKPEAFLRLLRYPGLLVFILFSEPS